MTLITHSIIGASVAQFFPSQPWLGLIAAVGSHYVSDVIPHISVANFFGSLKRGKNERQRPLEGYIYGWRFIKDASIVICDMLVGILLAWLIWKNSASLLIILIGVVGGTLPDLLQIAYGFLMKSKALLFFRKVHDFMHAPESLDIVNIPLGIISESSFIIFVVTISKLFS